MKTEEFDKIAIELFAPVLEPFGFSNDGSRYCTFHRKINDQLYHIIMPDIASRGVWYDVKVGPAAPCLDPEFQSKFPDSIGFSTAPFLNRWEGVGDTQQQFNCKSADNFRQGFKRDVATLLKEKALPFLDKFKSVGDMLPAIRNDLSRGLALFHLGKSSEAKPLLSSELNRLSNVKEAKALVKHLTEILAS